MFLLGVFVGIAIGVCVLKPILDGVEASRQRRHVDVLRACDLCGGLVDPGELVQVGELGYPIMACRGCAPDRGFCDWCETTLDECRCAREPELDKSAEAEMDLFR